jgi:hypothetical protein
MRPRSPKLSLQLEPVVAGGPKALLDAMNQSIRHRLICLVLRRATDGERGQPLDQVVCTGTARDSSRKSKLANLLGSLPFAGFGKQISLGVFGTDFGSDVMTVL